MPRQPRIEFDGAIYHVSARGDRQEPIFLDDADRERFLDCLAKACGRWRWEVRAWVLMGDHYHLALHTPQANLVEGMRWLQNAYTRYFNTRHQLWGPLFGGRYKSVLVDPKGAYQSQLIDYIHLNPARAQIVKARSKKGLLGYRWSSLPAAYALPPSKRPAWLDAATGFALADIKDTTAGRQRYVARLEERRAAEDAEELGIVEPEGQSLQSTMRRGWYWGTPAFREKLAKRLPAGKSKRSRNRRSSPLGKQQATERAETAAKSVIAELGLECDAEGRPEFSYGDPRRGATAWAVWRRSGASQQWIADRLGLRSAANVSQQLRRFDFTPDSDLPPRLRHWRKRQEKLIFDD